MRVGCVESAARLSIVEAAGGYLDPRSEVVNVVIATNRGPGTTTCDSFPDPAKVPLLDLQASSKNMLGTL